MSDAATVRLFLGFHGSRSDALALRSELEKCTIYIPEIAAWKPIEQLLYQAISDGKISVAQAKRLTSLRGGNEFEGGEFSVLAGTRKMVLFADLPEHHPAVPRLFALHDTVTRLPSGKRPFSEVVVGADIFMQHYAQLNREREEYMAGQFAAIARQYTGQRIFARLGASHTRMVRMLRTEGLDVTAIQQWHSLTFSVIEQVARYGSFSLPLPADAGARWLLEMLISSYIARRPAGLSMSRHRIIIGHILTISHKLSVSQIGELWDFSRASAQPAKELRKRLSEMGVVLPEQLA